MPSERVQRQIDRLLDETEAAVREPRLGRPCAPAPTPSSRSIPRTRTRARSSTPPPARAPRRRHPGTSPGRPPRRRSGARSLSSSPTSRASLRSTNASTRRTCATSSTRSGIAPARSSRATTAAINKLLGDAVMAVFGDPVAHEDDPLRAVRAALELHEAVEALNRDVEPRIGPPSACTPASTPASCSRASPCSTANRPDRSATRSTSPRGCVAREDGAGPRRTADAPRDRRHVRTRRPRHARPEGQGRARAGRARRVDRRTQRHARPASGRFVGRESS